MKKLLAIVVLGLLWSGSAYSNNHNYYKILESKTSFLNCAKEGSTFDKNKFEKTITIIDRSKGTIKSTIIFNSDFARKNNQQTVLIMPPKELAFMDDNYAIHKVIINGKTVTEEIYDFNKKTYEFIFNKKITRFKCS